MAVQSAREGISNKRVSAVREEKEVEEEKCKAPDIQCHVLLKFAQRQLVEPSPPSSDQNQLDQHGMAFEKTLTEAAKRTNVKRCEGCKEQQIFTMLGLGGLSK